MFDLEEIWKAWQGVLTWFLVLAAASVAAILAGAPQEAIALAVLALGTVLIGMGRTLLHLLEVIWLKRPDR